MEDEAGIRIALTAALEAYGAAIRGVGSVTAGLKALEEERPDVIISDIGMSGMNGYDLIEHIRANERMLSLGTVPAIAVTAFAGAEDRIRATASGFQGYIAKPVAIDHLVSEVRRVLGGTISEESEAGSPRR